MATLHALEEVRNVFGHGAGQEQEEQPADPPANALDELPLPVGFLVGLGVARDAAECQHVLGLLLAEDVHGVVVGDDADEHVRSIDDRDGDQVVLVDLAGDGLLVFVDAGKDDVALHDLFDHRRPSRQDQLLERDEPDQPALVIDDVAVIDRLAVGGLVADAARVLRGR